MNELTPGMIAVLMAYLAPFEPSDTYDNNTDRLLSTEIIISDLGDAADLNMNPVADFMAGQGYRYHCIHDDGISGWILRPKK